MKHMAGIICVPNVAQDHTVRISKERETSGDRIKDGATRVLLDKTL
jgi:hypothetical protein